MQTLQNQSTEELNQKLTELSKELLNYRMRHAGGHLTKTHMLTATRRDIARVKTALAVKRKESRKQAAQT